MSRVGKHHIVLPQGVSVSIENGEATVSGKLGTLKSHVSDKVNVSIENNEVIVKPVANTKECRMNWGTARANLNNMVKGVSEGFTRKLEMIGVGYRAQVNGNVLKLSLGFSHDIDYAIPEGIKIVCPDVTQIEISGMDKRLVGTVASEIRSYRSPEPYKGKGVKYAEETVRRKEGKKK
ncbi:MAG: 50S ribosomal protein L6 [Alphaproteobacteria bacterium]